MASQEGQNDTEQPDHSASLGDSVTSSTRMRFSVHTAQSSLVFIRQFFPPCWCACRSLLRGLVEPSSCLPVRQHPGADLGFQHLADFGARKVIPNFNLLGRFDAPEPLLHEGRYRGDVDGASCSRLHHSDNAFAPLLVWQTYDGTVRKGFVGREGFLNFDGIDVEAASNDHVFCAVDDVKEIVRVEVSD